MMMIEAGRRLVPALARHPVDDAEGFYLSRRNAEKQARAVGVLYLHAAAGRCLAWIIPKPLDPLRIKGLLSHRVRSIGEYRGSRKLRFPPELPGLGMPHYLRRDKRCVLSN